MLNDDDAKDELKLHLADLGRWTDALILLLSTGNRLHVLEADLHVESLEHSGKTLISVFGPQTALSAGRLNYQSCERTNASAEQDETLSQLLMRHSETS